MRWVLAWWAIVIWAAHDLVIDLIFGPDPFRVAIHIAVIPLALYLTYWNYRWNR